MKKSSKKMQVDLPPKEEAPCECHCHKYNHGFPEGQACPCITNCKHCNPNFQEPEVIQELPKEEPKQLQEVIAIKEPEEPRPVCGKCSKPKSGTPEATPDNYCKCGRPLKWKSIEELQSKIDAFFAWCDPHWTTEEYLHELTDKKGKKNGEFEIRTRAVMSLQRPYTITGLAMALETTRETLLDYEKVYEFDMFSDAIKNAKIKCHNYAETYLYEGKNQAGVIFNLKNNYGWKDKTESEVDVKSGGEKLQPGVIVLPPK